MISITGFKEFRKFESMEYRIMNCRAEITFLNFCIKNYIIPRRFKIKDTFKDLRISNMIKILSLRIMKREKGKLYAKISLMSEANSQEYKFLNARMKRTLFEFHIKRIKMNSNKWLRKKEAKLTIKQGKLSEGHEYKGLINYEAKRPTYLLTGKDVKVSDKVIKIFDNHPNYTQGNFENPKEEMCSQIQCVQNKDYRLGNLILKNLENVNKDLIKEVFLTNERLNYNSKNVLKELKDKNLFVTKSDKSGQNVILKEADFSDGLEKEIRKICSIEKKDNSKLIDGKLRKLLKEKGFSKEEISKMTTKNFVLPQAFGFVKTHKKDYPIRPVITTKGGPLQNLGFWLKNKLELLLEIPSKVIKDSFSLIPILEKFKNERNFLMVVADVRSMFPAISRDNLKKEIEEALKEKGEDFVKDICYLKIQDVMLILSFYLDNMQIGYKNLIFIQDKGITIGSPISTILANFYLGRLEDRILLEFKYIISYVRFIDDVLVFTNGNRNQVKEFFNAFKIFDQNLEFEIEWEKNREIQYLDMRIINNYRQLNWEYKNNPKKAGTILNFKSKHSNSIKMNIAREQIKRAIRLSSDVMRHNSVINVGKKLMNNEYPKSLVIKLALKEVLTSKLNGVKKSKEAKKYLPISIIPGLECIKKNTDSKRLGLINLPGKKVRNLRVNYNTPLSKTDKMNVVYKIPLNCGASYIGQTGRHLGKRIKEHVNNLKQGFQNSLLVRHVEDCGCIPLFDSVSILTHEVNYVKRQLKESLYMLKEPNAISEPSLLLNNDNVAFYKELLKF